MPANPLCGLLLPISIAISPMVWAEDDPFADHVVSYNQGTNPVPGYTDPSTALGSPERFTGESWDPMVVSAMNAAWRPDEIVSIGAGGSLVLQFDTPVADDPLNPHGIDLLIFGNSFLQDSEDGQFDHYCSDPAYIFTEGGTIEVSTDGDNWIEASGIGADGLFPTEGYLDLADPYFPVPGAIESDFTKPVDPAITIDDFDGLHYEQILDLYRGSGGGAGVDIGSLGLNEISFVRISNPAGSSNTPEIDGMADVRPRRPGDTNFDGAVDIVDLLDLLGHWGAARPAGWDCDFNGDAQVDVIDLLTLLAEWDY